VGHGLSNASCAGALIDHLTQHAEIILIEGESYRKREAERAQKLAADALAAGTASRRGRFRIPRFHVSGDITASPSSWTAWSSARQTSILRLMR
jgi:hypothetical protein